MMTSAKVIAEDLAFNTKKREIFKIPEKVWRKKVVPEEKLEIKLANMESEVIKNPILEICIFDEKLNGRIYFDSKEKVEGSGRVIIKKPGMKGMGDQGYDSKGFGKLFNCSCSEFRFYHFYQCSTASCSTVSQYLEDDGKLYNQEEFLKNYLENGFVTVEVISEIGVNKEHVEDKKSQGKESVVRDINNFCKDKSSSDFLVISEGEEIPCHRIILCSR